MGSGFNDFRISGFSKDNIPLIAPLWADYNLRQGGNVYYRVRRDAPTLAKARELIAENTPISYSEFLPSFCTIVTWLNVVLLSRSTVDESRVCCTIINSYLARHLKFGVTACVLLPVRLHSDNVLVSVPDLPLLPPLI